MCHSHHDELPVRRPRDRNHGLRKERERKREREHEAGAPAPVDPDEAERREPVQREADGGQHRLPAVELLRAERGIERRQLRERDDRPNGHQREEPAEQEAGVPDEALRAYVPELERRERREDAGDHEPDRRRELEAGVRPEQHGGGRERVQAEKAGARDERERDQQEARVAPPAGCDADCPTERRRESRRAEHEPEVRLLVLPRDVDRGAREQDREEHERRGDDGGQRANADSLDPAQPHVVLG